MDRCLMVFKIIRCKVVFKINLEGNKAFFFIFFFGRGGWEVRPTTYIG